MGEAPLDFFIDLLRLSTVHQHVVSFAQVLYEGRVLLVGERLAHFNEQVANKKGEKEPHNGEGVGEAVGCNLGSER